MLHLDIVIAGVFLQRDREVTSNHEGKAGPGHVLVHHSCVATSRLHARAKWPRVPAIECTAHDGAALRATPRLPDTVQVRDAVKAWVVVKRTAHDPGVRTVVDLQCQQLPHGR